MIGLIRRRWGVPVAAVFVWSMLIAIATPTAATEPDGNFRLKLDRLPSGTDAVVVRLTIRPFAVIDDASLTISGPIAFELLSRTPSGHSSFLAVNTEDGGWALRSELQHLDPGVFSTLDFELVLPPGEYGTLDFVVLGRDETDRVHRGAIGLALRQPGSSGVRRLGAMEFPAVVLRPGEKR